MWGDGDRREGNGKVKILIVDDERSFLESLSAALTSWHFEVVRAQSVAEALVHLSGKKPTIDLVITDHVMPGGSGLELIKAIRKENPNLPVIMMSGYDNKSLLIEAMRHGCSGFIEKPFRMETLLLELERVEGNLLKKAVGQQDDRVSMHLHQINNPLMCIMASAEIAMIHGKSDQFMRERLSNILEAANRIREINNSLIRGGSTTSTGENRVNISKVVEDCVKHAQDLIKMKDVQVILELEPDPLMVRATGWHMEQVFKNLLANSIEALDGCQRRQVMLTTKRDLVANEAAIHVEDSGNGIADETVEKIFQPYFTTKVQGTGLGLAVVRNILRRYHGRIFVESHPGRGSIFSVRMPLAGSAETGNKVSPERGEEKLIIADGERDRASIAGVSGSCRR